MTVVSLFDGISCGRVALDRAGIPVEEYVAFEIDPFAIQISQRNYPSIVHCGDVRAADFTRFRYFDALIGGSPCQSLSITRAEIRTNLHGKSKLFFEYLRAKEEMQPTWFLFENVASMDEESKQIISELLGCDPIFIDSKDFSAQQRPRLYWTNIPVDLSTLPHSTMVLGDILQPADQIDDSLWYHEPLYDLDLSKQVCATLDININLMHKRVFNPAFKCHTLTCVSGGNQQKKVLQDGRPRKLTPLEYERLQTLPDDYTACVSNARRYTAIGNGWTVDTIAWILKQIPA